MGGSRIEAPISAIISEQYAILFSHSFPWFRTVKKSVLKVPVFFSARGFQEKKSEKVYGKKELVQCIFHIISYFHLPEGLVKTQYSAIKRWKLLHTDAGRRC